MLYTKVQKEEEDSMLAIIMDQQCKTQRKVFLHRACAIARLKKTRANLEKQLVPLNQRTRNRYYPLVPCLTDFTSNTLN